MITIFKTFEEIQYNQDGKLLGYHVTQERNLKSIMKKGLVPKVPKDFGDDGDYKGVYLFKTKDDMDNAMYNWMGERIEEWEEDNDKEFKETLLTVDLTGMEFSLIDSVEYEWTCTETIPPERIIKIEKMY